MSPMSRAVLPLLLAGAAACGGTEGGRPAAAAKPDTVVAALHGALLQTPRPKTTFVLTRTDGQPYDFKRETDGFVTLLFFGYTHCPDICPVHMANLGAVLKNLPPAVSGKVKVVFVTVDPARDSAAVVAKWLANFHPEFVGLVGTEAEINAALQATRVPLAIKEPPATDKAQSVGYTMGHSAFVLAYTADGFLRVLYPFGTRQGDWALDLPQLVGMGGA